MKILVLSDTHLTPRFEQKKFEFLGNIIQKSDSVIINGDFWDAYLSSFEHFIDSPWKKLFPLLKKKNSIYIYGNHDAESFSDKKYLMHFSSKQLHSYSLNIEGYKYEIEHGHRLLRNGLKNPKIITKTTRLKIKIIDAVEYSVSNSSYKIFNRTLSVLNKGIKKKLSKFVKPNVRYIFGHTHAQELDLENQFINTGFSKHGFAEYMWLDESGPKLFHERYR